MQIEDNHLVARIFREKFPRGSFENRVAFGGMRSKKSVEPYRNSVTRLRNGEVDRARTHMSDGRNSAVGDAEAPPRALQTSECNELLNPTRTSYMILVQRQPGKLQGNCVRLSYYRVQRLCHCVRILRHSTVNEGVVQHKIKLRRRIISVDGARTNCGAALYRWTERERTCPMQEILLWVVPKHPLGRYRPLSAVSCSTLRERAT
jgi:hypothetical protein